MLVSWRNGVPTDRFLKRLLEAWNQELRAYEEVLRNPELPYIYGERSNVGHLALAARSIGAFPWYEPPSPYSDGRPDLAITTPNGKTYWFEAKWIEPNKSRNMTPKDLSRLIKERLGWARQDALRRKWTQEDVVIAIVFAVLAVDAAYAKSFKASSFRTLSRKIVDERGRVDFSAAHMCSRTIWTDGDNLNPGVLLCGRFVRRP